MSGSVSAWYLDAGDRVIHPVTRRRTVTVADLVRDPVLQTVTIVTTSGDRITVGWGRVVDRVGASAAAGGSR